jgi:glycosyltransferase involved in cell wall biosynthesis
VCIHYIDIKKNTTRLKHQSARDLIMYTFKAYWKSRALLRAGGYDYIHAFFGVPCGSIAQILSRQFHIPYMISLRGSDVPGFSDRYVRIYPFLRRHIVSVWRHATHVVANSAGLRDLARETAPHQDIDVIYNGIDTDTFSPTLSTAQKDDTFVVLTASRLMRRKGINYIIDAVERLKDRHPHRAIKLIIAGGAGDASHELTEQVRTHNLTQDVLFTGEYDGSADIIPAYRKADAFVMASLNEGMSNNMLEALACGLPLVMSRTGGVEILTDGVDALVVDRGDASAICDALERIMLDPKLAQRMRAAARARAEKLSWTHVATAYEELYYARH